MESVDNQPTSTHLLQSPAWGSLKSRFGWTSLQVTAAGGSAQILFRRLPLGLTIAYIPKGPRIDWRQPAQAEAIFSAIHAEAKRRRAIFLKVEPDVLRPAADHSPDQSQPAQRVDNFLQQAGFRPADTIQPQTSLVIDISGQEADILAAMKQKTRYNIRLARRKGVTVRGGSRADIAIFYRLAQLTASRDNFAIHSQAYYQTAYDLFGPERCGLLLAEYEAEVLAALMIFRQDRTAYYLYGASSNEHRNRMPTYLVQWEAIRWAKRQGCTAYDLWGIPDASPQILEAEFSQRSAGLWSVYRFKRGFGGAWVQSVGAYDYVYRPLLYSLYRLRRGLG